MLEPGVQGVEFVELNRNVRDCENKRPRWWYYPSFIGGKQWQIESESLCLRWEDHPLLSSLDGYTGCTPRNMPIQNLPPENPYSTLFQLQHSLPQNCVWFSLIWRGSNHGRPEIIMHGIMVQVEKLNDDLRVVRSMIQIIIVCYLLFSFLWSTFWICQNLRHFWLADQAGFTRLVGSGGCKQRAVPQTQISEIFDVHVSLVPLLRFIPSLWILPAQYGDIFPIPLTYGGAISERSCRFFFLFVGELSVADPTAQERHPLQSLLVSSTEVARLPCASEFAKLAAKTWNNLRGSTWRLPVGFCLIRCGKRGIGWFPCEVYSNIVGQ